MAGTFADHFSDHAARYAAYRPSYPADLIAFVAGTAPATRHAWDCGSGNGQAAVAIARHFDRVIASDPSAEQLAAATQHPHVRYVRAAERIPDQPSQSIDLVTVAQALHWLDLDAFYAEVDRVLVDRGVLAVWTYLRPRVDPAIDVVIDWFHDERIGKYWPRERKHVDSGYRTLAFPYPEIPSRDWRISIDMPREAFIGYVSTWSSVRQARLAGEDALPEFVERLNALWPVEDFRNVTWPIVLRLGRRGH